MGFSICMQKFENQDFSTFKRSVVWDIFGPKAYVTKEGWGLWYSKTYSGVLHLEDDEEITGFCLNRPGADALTDFYEVARRVPSLINWTDSCAVADAAFIPGIPDWLLKAFKQPPAVVRSADELMECIARD